MWTFLQRVKEEIDKMIASKPMKYVLYLFEMTFLFSILLQLFQIFSLSYIII